MIRCLIIQKSGIDDLVVDLIYMISEIEGINDLGLLVNIFRTFPKISSYIVSNIQEIISTFGEFNINLSDIDIAIDTLEKYGFSIKNREDILKKVENSEFGEIEIFQENGNDKDFTAFVAEPDKTYILLRVAVEQFLERASQDDFFLKRENIDNCLILLNSSYQNMMGLDDDLEIKIFSTLREQLSNPQNITLECRETLEQEINRSEIYFEKYKYSQKLLKFLQQNQEDMIIPDSIISFWEGTEIDARQLNEIIIFFLSRDMNNENLENINNVLEIFENGSYNSNQSDIGRDRMIEFLMLSANYVSITDENRGILTEIYQKLQSIDGLDEETISFYLFIDEDVKAKMKTQSVSVWADLVKQSEGRITTTDVKKSQKCLMDIELNLLDDEKTLEEK